MVVRWGLDWAVIDTLLLALEVYIGSDDEEQMKRDACFFIILDDQIHTCSGLVLNHVVYEGTEASG